MARRIAGVVALLALLSVLMAATCAAGRRAGWAPNPGEPSNAWAERSRFQVNDTLVMDAAAKVCYLELKGHFCAGRDRAALNADGSKDCKDHGYTRGGLCSDVTNICICEKPCAAEKTTARARD